MLVEVKGGGGGLEATLVFSDATDILNDFPPIPDPLPQNGTNGIIIIVATPI